MQFMASIALDTAGRRSEVEQTLPAEQARVLQLMQQGVLSALYVPEAAGAPDGLWAVFNGASLDEVQGVIETLPLYPYMQLQLFPLRDLQAHR
jgi:muconolactone delta-isomerase